MAKETLIFLHIPKTAGTSVRYILRRNYPRRDIYHVRQIAMAGYYFALLDFTSRYRQFACVIGHYGFGVHRHIHHDCAYFTMLRDPVRHFVSTYNFILRKKGHPMHRVVTSRRLSLEAFIDDELGRSIANQQVRFLAAVDGHCKKYADDGDAAADLELAKSHLALGVKVVGLTEQFDESLLLLRQHFRWQDIRYTRKNASSNAAVRVPDRVTERIMDLNRQDLQLYEYARMLMGAQIESYEGDFQADLRELKAANADYASQNGTVWHDD